ncbi:DUF2752 domain-containing protein [Phycicoccus sp. CSK15P-2]|uniref:DUF2752 domain-containing protein n=1 Tax=Phycicoccus sp. CSK15P-2 TaxID=2807627 RepID=UPI00194F0F76|nr:DUF2752 domain-containing protein [Phycicoccus sp. CSK15P-2]MBM6403157.1 DUF2752 domain-containing protein [Phycicoccus sp. CSK15P-2]
MTQVEEAAALVDDTSRGRRLLLPAGIATAVAAGTTYVWAVDPNQPGHYPLCPTLAIGGIYCPGCGMLRATHDLAHLDIAGAVAMNPLAIPLYIGVVVLFVVWVRARWQGRTLHWDPPTWMPAALGISFVVFTVARNVPGWTLLAPG